MAREIVVAAQPRSTRGKNESRRLRVKGLIPGIVYGAFKDAVAVAVDPKQMLRIMHSKSGQNTIFDVQVDGSAAPAMIVDWQFDPVKDTLLHVDLKRIDLTKRLRVNVPVLTEGEPQGVKIQGGLLEIVTREVEIECLPDEIPEHFVVSVTDLMMNQSVRVGDIAMPVSVKLVSSPDGVVAHVVAMRAEETTTTAETPEAAPAAGGTAAEPEVIKKGKKEEEEAEAEGKKKK